MKERKIIRRNIEIIVEKEGVYFELSSNPFMMGRDRVNCDLVIENPAVSRKHAKIVKENNNWILEDLGSASGTFLNENKLFAGEQRNIKPTDHIQLAEFSINILAKDEKIDEIMKKQKEQKEHIVKIETKVETIENNEEKKIIEECENEKIVSDIQKEKSNSSNWEQFKIEITNFLIKEKISKKGIEDLKKILINVSDQGDLNIIEDTFSDVIANLPVLKNSEEVERERKETRVIRRPKSNEIENKQEETIKIPENLYEREKKEVEQPNKMDENYNCLVFQPINIDGDWVKIPIIKTPFVIGKSEAHSDFQLNARGISKSHCLISFHNQQFYILDMRSTNGVKINKKKIKIEKEYKLKNRDRVFLANNEFMVVFPR